MKLYIPENDISPDNSPASSISSHDETDDYYIKQDIDIKQNMDELPAKYTKLLVFGEWILNQIHISDADRENARNIFQVYNEPHTQYDFYNTFATSEKQIQKTMKKHISQQKKLPKNIAHCSAKQDIPKTRNQILKEEYINTLISMFDVQP
jgi:hypothetical protein